MCPVRTSPQSRSFTYDGLGRMTSETNPETGGVSYVYDSEVACGGSAGDLVKKTDPIGNVTCYGYDALHRTTSITYPSGQYAATTPEKHFVYDSAVVAGLPMANAKGRLAEAYTGTSKTTDLGFEYSARGEVTDTLELTPHSGGYYHVAASYWPNGLINTLIPNQAGLPNWTYTPDGEGRINSVTALNGQNPVTSTGYSGFGPTLITFGSGDSDSYTYDANTARMTQYQFMVNGSSETGTLSWNANGTLQSLVVSDPFNGSDTQTCNSSYL